MNQRLAFRITFGFWLLSIALAIWYTFVDQDLMFALVIIPSTFTMFFYLKNPRLLMAKSFDEFGELFDESRDKKYLWGCSTYHLLIVAAVMYIVLV